MMRWVLVAVLLLLATEMAFAQQRPARDDGLKVGEVAPTFKLKALDGKAQTDLEAFRGEKPVVLVFGSYT